MADQNADTQTEAHRRGHARLRVGVAAYLETLEGRRSARLVDLSQTGAHVLVSNAQRLRRAVVSWLNFEAFAYVVWADGDHLGFEFDEPISRKWLLATRERAPAVVRNEALGDPDSARSFVEGRTSFGS